MYLVEIKLEMKAMFTESYHPFEARYKRSEVAEKYVFFCSIRLLCIAVFSDVGTGRCVSSV
jgi:hypothetical protein